MSTAIFSNVSCSQCGRDFGPGAHGFSHCRNHNPRTQGAQQTRLVECDYLPEGELLAGFEVDDDGALGLTHLWLDGRDVYLLAVEVPAAVKQIVDGLKASLWESAGYREAWRRSA